MEERLSPVRPIAVTHVTFGTSNFSESIARLGRSAERFGQREFRVYTPDSAAVRQAIAENPEIMALSRGAGYWLWKPYLILDAMDALREGDGILYTDAGMVYVADPAPLFRAIGDSDIAIFHSDHPAGTHRMWTKRDCLVLLDADTEEYTRAFLTLAGIQYYRVGPLARAFVSECKEAMRDPRVLTDAPNACGLSNYPEFVEHRHDQSVLSIMALRHGVRTFRTPSEETAGGDPRFLYPMIFERHRQRDPGAPLHLPLVTPAPRTYTLDDRIDFADPQQSLPYALGGWSAAERWGTWTCGRSAGIRLAVGACTGDLELAVDAQPFVCPSHARLDVDVLANGVVIDRWTYRAGESAGSRRTTIPNVLITTHGGVVEITLAILNPASPAEHGISSDSRQLGLGVSSVVLRNAPRATAR